jgi:hypothetical protein
MLASDALSQGWVSIRASYDRALISADEATVDFKLRTLDVRGPSPACNSTFIHLGSGFKYSTSPLCGRFSTVLVRLSLFRRDGTATFFLELQLPE